MTTPVLAYTNPISGDRMYMNPLTNEGDYKSVTSILGATVTKPSLLTWSARCVADASTWIMQDLVQFGASSESMAPYIDEETFEIDWELLADDLAKIPNSLRDSAGELGDQVHQFLEEMLGFSFGNPRIAKEWLEIQKPVLTDDQVSRLETVVRFLEQNSLQVLLLEETMYNDTLRYAGTCDLVCMLNGERFFIDLKTGSGIYPEAALQLNAYCFSHYVITKDNEKLEFTDIHPDMYPGSMRAGILHIPKGGVGTAQLKEVEVSQRAFDIFRILVALERNWNSDMSRKVLKRGRLWRDEG